MAFHAELEHLANVCEQARKIYERDMDEQGSIAPAWHALDRMTRDIYIDKAALKIAETRVVPFPQPVRPVPPGDLVPYAVRNIEAGITDLINAANAATGKEAHELQRVIGDLLVKLNAADQVAWHREEQFFPKGA